MENAKVNFRPAHKFWIITNYEFVSIKKLRFEQSWLIKTLGTFRMLYQNVPVCPRLWQINLSKWKLGLSQTQVQDSAQTLPGCVTLCLSLHLSGPISYCEDNINQLMDLESITDLIV